MANRTSDAEWRGDLKTGHGAIKLGSGAFEGQYSYNSRFAEGVGTNPEEPIAAAHAGCFSMALAAVLSERGHAPSKIHTNAKVQFGPVPGGFAITTDRSRHECFRARHRRRYFPKGRHRGKRELSRIESPQSDRDHAVGQLGMTDRSAWLRHRSMRVPPRRKPDRDDLMR
jgi:OsmC subfamily peroxiredoxin